MGFQSSIIAIGTITVQIVLNRLGHEAVAGYTAAQKIDQLGILPMMSFGITMARIRKEKEKLCLVQNRKKPLLQ